MHSPSIYLHRISSAFLNSTVSHPCILTTRVQFFSLLLPLLREIIWYCQQTATSLLILFPRLPMRTACTLAKIPREICHWSPFLARRGHFTPVLHFLCFSHSFKSCRDCQFPLELLFLYCFLKKKIRNFKSLSWLSNSLSGNPSDSTICIITCCFVS